MTISSGDKVLILYTHPNMGKKVVKSPTTFEQYGYFGGGSVFEVLKADVRLRPDYYGTCGNCRQSLTVTPSDVFCPRCSNIEAAVINRPEPAQVARAIQSIEPAPEPVPDPIAIHNDLLDEADEYMVDIRDTVEDVPLSDFDFGRSVNKRHLALLSEKGILSIGDAVEAGPEKLQSISGIGTKVVEAIMKNTNEK